MKSKSELVEVESKLGCVFVLCSIEEDMYQTVIDDHYSSRTERGQFVECFCIERFCKTEDSVHISKSRYWAQQTVYSEPEIRPVGSLIQWQIIVFNQSQKVKTNSKQDLFQSLLSVSAFSRAVRVFCKCCFEWAAIITWKLEKFVMLRNYRGAQRTMQKRSTWEL